MALECTLTACMCIAQPQAKFFYRPEQSVSYSKMGGGKNKKKKGSSGGGGGGGAQKSGGGGKKQKAAAEPVPVEDEFDPMNPPEADEDDDAGVDYDDGVEGVSEKMNELAVGESDDLLAQASASSVDTSGNKNSG